MRPQLGTRSPYRMLVCSCARRFNLTANEQGLFTKTAVESRAAQYKGGSVAARHELRLHQLQIIVGAGDRDLQHDVPWTGAACRPEPRWHRYYRTPPLPQPCRRSAAIPSSCVYSIRKHIVLAAVPVTLMHVATWACNPSQSTHLVPWHW